MFASIIASTLSRPRITMSSSQLVTDFVGGSPALAQIALTNTGLVQAITLGMGTVTLEQWITPVVNVGLYSIRAHLNSGSAVSGSAMDTDLALSTSRGWSITQSTVGTKTSQLLLTLKLVSSGATLATATIDLSATRA